MQDDRQMFPPFGGGGFPSQPPFGGGGFPSQPPFGGGGFPSQPPFGGGGQGQGQAPQGPPPSFVPSQSTAMSGPSAFAVDPGAMRRCLFRFTYVWLNNGSSFWFYPTFIGRNSVAGFRWRRRQNRWVYFGIDTRQISSFQCF
ncbi:transporter [Peribacillus alkalitolerans]|uniref:transporter n=1 Tax=Peribacillus alkalitolerans TaxID=1550385 RepID=UPI0013D2792C|nr:transporter [Peribacillus alkalitolerans]